MCRGLSIVATAFAVMTIVAPAKAAGPGSTLLMSRPDGLGALPPAGDNHSGDVSLGSREEVTLSGDGRFVVFTSAADDLGVRDGRTHVYVRDAATDTTTLVDRGPGGVPGNGNARNPVISRDGSAVCFSSTASNLVAGVGPNVVSGTLFGHLYVVRLATGAIDVADRATGPDGALANKQEAQECALDADGSRVAFRSFADNLVPNDTNGTFDVFVRDLAALTTQRISVTSAGAQSPQGGGEPSISGDGSRIAFTSSSELTSPETLGIPDVYVRDTTVNTTFRGSLGTGGVEPNGGSREGSISHDGNRVAFASNATNLATGDSNMQTDVFVRSISNDETALVSRAAGPTGEIGNNQSSSPVISGDGLGVAFVSIATNLGAGAPPGPGGILYVRTLGGAQPLEAVSRASGAGGRLGVAPRSPSLATAPTTVTWTSSSDVLDSVATGEFSQVFRRELGGAKPTELVSRPTGSGPRNSGVNRSELGPGSISADGRFVAFTSESDALSPLGAGRLPQAYVRDNLTHTTTLVSRAAGEGPVADIGVGPGSAAISPDGSHVAFISPSTNLVTGVTGTNVYVRSLATGELRVASRSDGPDGPPVQNLTIFDRAGPSLSQDGTRVAFATVEKLTGNDRNDLADVFVRDVAANTTTLASIATNGESGTGTSFEPRISADGTRVAFTSDSPSLVEGPLAANKHVYVRDLAAGTTRVVDPGGQADFGAFPTLSADGNRVAFHSSAQPTGDPAPERSVYVHDLAAGTTVLASRADGAGGAAAQVRDTAGLSADGRAVTFSGFGLPGAPDAAHAQVFRRDLEAGTTTLVSAPDGGTVALADSVARSSAPDVDGTCVAFDATANGLANPDHATVDFEQVWLRTVARECPKVGPDTTITEGPGDRVRRPTVRFAFVGSEAGVTFVCALDGAPAAPCASPFTTPPLADGVRRFSVAAVDTAGVADPTPALATFRIAVVPVISKASLSRKRFAVGSKNTLLSAQRRRRTPRGTTIRSSLSEPATVRIAIGRRLAGRRVGKKCVRPTPRLRKLRGCMRVSKVATLTRTARKGRNSVQFTGRFSRRRFLRPGTYQAVLRATDAAGNRSKARKLLFRVVAR